MAVRLVALALLLGTTVALAFDSTKIGQWGSLYLDDLSPILAKSAQLKQEVTAALTEKNKKPEEHYRCAAGPTPDPRPGPPRGGTADHSHARVPGQLAPLRPSGSLPLAATPGRFV